MKKNIVLNTEYAILNLYMIKYIVIYTKKKIQRGVAYEEKN